MGFVIGEQLRALGASLLLGACLALLYDLLRALRLHRGALLTAVLDGLYCVLAAAAFLAFALRVGGGELRLYMLLGALGGAALFFALLSPVLRPLWDFWAGVLGALFRLFCLPLRWSKIIYGKLHKFCKKGFLFARDAAIIRNWERAARSARFQAEQQEGWTHGAKEQSRRQKRTDEQSLGRKACDFGAVGRSGRSARHDQRAQPERRS